VHLACFFSGKLLFGFITFDLWVDQVHGMTMCNLSLSEKGNKVGLIFH
jgi:hypothetical protein